MSGFEEWPLPEDWKWERFDQVASVASDLVSPSDFEDSPHIAPNHIASGTGELLPYSTVGNDGVTSPKHRFRRGQILYSKIRPYLAKATMAEFDGLCSADMYPIDAHIVPGYLLKWMLSVSFTAQASGHQGRTVLPKINQKALAALRVPVPPMETQYQISNRLELASDSLSRVKRHLKTIPTLLEKYRQSVLAAAFRGDLTREWRARNPDVEPASVLLERIRRERRARWEQTELAKMTTKGKPPKDDKWKAKYREPTPVDTTNLPQLPEGWCWASIDELTEIVTSGSRGWAQYYSTQGALFIRVGNLRRTDIALDLSSRTHVNPPNDSEGSRTKLIAGDVVISITADVGMVALIPEDIEESYINQHVALLRNLATVNSEFLAFALLDPGGFQRIVKKLQYGATKSGLSLIQLRDLPVAISPSAEQGEIVSVLRQKWTGLYHLQSQIDDASQRLATLSQAILAKAFRGELLPNDESDATD